MRDKSGEAAKRGSREEGSRGSGDAGQWASWAVVQRLAKVLRRIAGMPDYKAHLEHLRTHHPESPMPSRREFFESFLESRYEGGPSRCC